LCELKKEKKEKEKILLIKERGRKEEGGEGATPRFEEVGESLQCLV
jgi:hypothetical protein